MATQHPDNAGMPYFDNNKFINVNEELQECYRSYNDLNCDEYMFDWEGKFADSSLVEKLYRNYTDFFIKNPLGKNIFLTMRIPNIWEGANFSLPQAFMSILTSKDIATELKLKQSPIFEIILPMTKNADQLIAMQKVFVETATFKHKAFKSKDDNFKHINIIPLFEGIYDLTGCKTIIEEYLKKCKKEFEYTPDHMRVFIARSDPAMNSGMIPAVISCKAALSNFAEIEENYGIKLYPIIGCGSLPFRGGMNPYNLEKVLPEYEGIRTITAQSAFRYDYPMDKVKEAIEIMKKELPKGKMKKLDSKTFNAILRLNEIFEKHYKSTIESIADIINDIAKTVPSRRERVQHIGLLGYSRGVGKVKLPRAISFTCSMYSLGVPPEFIATGRGLLEAKKEGLLETLESLYPTLRHELIHAGKYLNYENLNSLAKEFPEFENIEKDIKLTKEILDIDIGPFYHRHFIHRNMTSTIYHKWKLNENFLFELEEAAVMRRSLG